MVSANGGVKTPEKGIDVYLHKIRLQKVKPYET